MNASLTIRRATLADAGAISALIAGVAHFCTLRPDGAGAERFLTGIGEAAIGTCISAPEFAYFVGECDGRIGGVVALRAPSHLYHLFVANDMHGRGIGARLWRHALTHLQQQGTPEFITVNSTVHAQPMYRHFGFRETSARIEQDGIAYVPMRLELSASTA